MASGRHRSTDGGSSSRGRGALLALAIAVPILVLITALTLPMLVGGGSRQAGDAAPSTTSSASPSESDQSPAGSPSPDAGFQPADDAAVGSPQEARAESTPLPSFQDPTKTTPTTQRAVPVRVQVPAIGVDSELETLQRDGTNKLLAPVDWQLAGWYKDAPVPGDRGPAVIAGHLTAPDGPGVFYNLPRLGAGDEIFVINKDGERIRFVVNSVLSAERNTDFPTDRIYGPTPDAQLRLITCDGEYDPSRGHWTRNLVVFASIAD